MDSTDGLRRLVEQLAPIAEAVLAAKGELESVESIEIAHVKAQNALFAAEAEYKSRVDQIMVARQEIDAAKAAKAEADSYTRSLVAKAKEEANEIISKAKADAQAEAERITARQQVAIIAITDRREKAEAELKAIQAEIAKFRQEHDQVLASMNVLASKLKIG